MTKVFLCAEEGRSGRGLFASDIADLSDADGAFPTSRSEGSRLTATRRRSVSGGTSPTSHWPRDVRLLRLSFLARVIVVRELRCGRRLAALGGGKGGKRDRQLRRADCGTLPVFSAVKIFFVTVELLPRSLPPTESARQSVSERGAKSALSRFGVRRKRSGRGGNSCANRQTSSPGGVVKGSNELQPLPDLQVEESPRLLFCNRRRRRQRWRPRPNFSYPPSSPSGLTELAVFVKPLQSKGEVRLVAPSNFHKE